MNRPAGTAESSAAAPSIRDDDGAQELSYFGADPGWQLFDPAEFWAYRELLLVFAIRDLKVRYRQAAIGALWAILQPVATMLIFVTLFHLLGRKPAESEAPYAVTAYIGVLVWQLFAYVVRESSTSLVGNRDLITKVYFPRALLPASTVLCGLIDFLFAVAVLVPLMFAFDVVPGTTALWLPAFLFGGVLTALAAGIWFAALNALYRDIGHLVPFLLQVGFFVTPVVYETAALIPEAWRPVWRVNPLVGVIEGCRWSLLSPLGAARPSFATLAASILVSTALLLTGLLYLRRVERWIADRI